MGNSNSNFNAGKNTEILSKLKNLLAESESKPAVVAECNNLITNLKNLIENSEEHSGHSGRSMTNDFKVNAVSGDTEPGVTAAQIDIVAVDMPSRNVFESSEAKPSMMGGMIDEMIGGMSLMEGGSYLLDNLKSLLGLVQNLPMNQMKWISMSIILNNY